MSFIKTGSKKKGALATVLVLVAAVPMTVCAQASRISGKVHGVRAPHLAGSQSERKIMKRIALLLSLSFAFGSTAYAGEPTSTSNGYKISFAAPDFVPTKVWDDGKFTFIELKRPYRSDLPVVFALAEDGSRSLVNFQWDEQNSRFVVQRVLERAVLILGNKSVVVSRT